MDDALYNAVRICLNGHLVDTAPGRYSEVLEALCARCGERTVTTCPRCNVPIRGPRHREVNSSSAPLYTVPAFCFSCGANFQWTFHAVQAARDLAVREASRAGIMIAETDLFALIYESLRTRPAALRVRQALMAANPAARERFHAVMRGVVSSSAKQVLFGVEAVDDATRSS